MYKQFENILERSNLVAMVYDLIAGGTTDTVLIAGMLLSCAKAMRWPDDMSVMSNGPLAAPSKRKTLL